MKTYKEMKATGVNGIMLGRSMMKAPWVFKAIEDKCSDADLYNYLAPKEIGNLLGVDHSTYASWERGRDLFPLKQLLILANFYHVDIDYITDISPKKKYQNEIVNYSNL